MLRCAARCERERDPTAQRLTSHHSTAASGEWVSELTADVFVEAGSRALRSGLSFAAAVGLSCAWERGKGDAAWSYRQRHVIAVERTNVRVLSTLWYCTTAAAAAAAVSVVSAPRYARLVLRCAAVLVGCLVGSLVLGHGRENQGNSVVFPSVVAGSTNGSGWLFLLSLYSLLSTLYSSTTRPLIKWWNGSSSDIHLQLRALLLLVCCCRYVYYYPISSWIDVIITAVITLGVIIRCDRTLIDCDCSVTAHRHYDYLPLQ